MDFLRIFLITLLVLPAFTSISFAATPPALTLAKKYAGVLDLKDYWVSEKYDGVRAYWDGDQLISRNGGVFAAPDWFIADFPKVALDGELWIRHGAFEETMSVVRRQQPHQGWCRVKYMVFDLPEAGGDFDVRLKKMTTLIEGSPSQFLFMVRQEKIIDEVTLMKELDAITAVGGEGLILRRADVLYQGGRSSNLLKLKKFDDAEAVVLQHLPGKGKYQGITGSIVVKDAESRVFNIGSGLTDKLRRQPPPIGSTITFRYQGRYQSGLPRFPVFWRQRAVVP